jgi:diacylglycerol kinase family enzyme
MIGGGLKVSPLAKIDDDYLDFTTVRKFKRSHTIPYLMKVLSGKIYTIPAVISRKCKKVVIDLPNNTYEYDGNIITNQDKVTIVLGGEKINFIG